MDADLQTFIERVKQANNIEDVIDESGFKLQRKRGNYLRSQEHDSLVIRVDEQYYVWNSNNETGDVFDWLMNRRGWDFMEALKFLAERAHLEFPKQFTGGDAPTRLAARLREDVWTAAARVMAEWLWADAEALAYARGRGWSDETIREAGLGFSGRDPAAAAKKLAAEFGMYEAADSPQAVAICGFRGDVRGWGKAHNIEVQENWVEWGMIPGLVGRTRLIYPHYQGGKVGYYSARNILGAEINKEGREVKAYNLPVVLAGARQAMYNHVYGRRAEQVVIVEGQADAVTLGEWGLAGVALAGTSWEDHRELLKALAERHETVYIGLDADQAGENALQGRDNNWPLGHILGPMTRVVRWSHE